jgi:tRNA(Ile)-lysidine synthase TilS/MesJ
MRSCNRCIKYNLKYFILKQFKLCAEYIFANCIFYLLIITEADWRRVRAKKKNLKRAFTS